MGRRARDRLLRARAACDWRAATCNDITAGYPELGRLQRALGSQQAVLDGEIVAFDDEGRPSFERLQARMHLTGSAEIARAARAQPVIYMIFDLL